MIRKFLKENNLSLEKISYKGHSKILFTNKNKLICKNKKTNLLEIHNYLKAKKYDTFLPLLNNYNDNIEIYPYIEEKITDKSSKAIDLIYELSMLHIKTTSYEEVNLDNIKKLFEDLTNRCNYLYKYYLDLQDYIENNVYMAPAEYLLIRNISLIYKALLLAKEKLNAWYNTKEDKVRYVLLNNNLKLSNFLIGARNYFLNWNYSKRDRVVYDFLNFFQNNYLDIDMKSLYDLYQSKYKYTKNEEYLFFCLLLLPWEIDFNNSNYINTIKVKNLIIYIEKVLSFLEDNNIDKEKNK